MKNFSKKTLPLLFGAALLLPPCFAGASTMRPAVGKHLLQAESYLKTQNYAAALREVNAASAVGGLSPDESLAIAQLRGAAEGGAGEYELAAQSYETVLASGNEAAETRLLLIQAIAGFYDHAGDYAQTVAWVDKYVAAGGLDPQVRALAAQAEYAQGHYAAALQAVRHDGAGGTKLPEAELQLAVSAAQKSADKQAYFEALQALLKAYPSPAYWNAAITLVQEAPGFPDALTLDAYQLRVATNTLTTAGDYEDYAERAILAGQPAEAKRVLDAGFTAGVLTAQTDAGHAARLQALAGKTAAAVNVSAVPASALDQAVATGRGFGKVPGFAEGRLDTPEAALARLWAIARP